MPRFPADFVSKLKDQADIVEVVGRYVQLKKQGSAYLGVCPFHQDHKPSMHVTPSMGIYKCFACGAGGDVFKFVQEHEHVEFLEAVKIVAELVGVPLPAEESEDPREEARRKEQARLLEMHRLACDFFQTELRNCETAKEYLKGRGLTGRTAKEFALGWAPDSWDALPDFLRGRGYSDKEILLSGMGKAREGGNGLYGRFRARVMFPIFSPSKSVIGFTGRTLDPEEPAKYLNSPETPIYHKGDVLFGLSHAREEIRKKGRAVVVEGNVDVIQLWQGGVRNVVAASGTAFTPAQARLLKRIADGVVLVFDGDAAGQHATDRSLPILFAQGLEVRILALSDGKDPDDFVREKGGEGTSSQEALYRYFSAYKVGTEKAPEPAPTPEAPPVVEPAPKPADPAPIVAPPKALENTPPSGVVSFLQKLLSFFS